MPRTKKADILSAEAASKENSKKTAESAVKDTNAEVPAVKKRTARKKTAEHAAEPANDDAPKKRTTRKKAVKEGGDDMQQSTLSITPATKTANITSEKEPSKPKKRVSRKAAAESHEEDTAAEANELKMSVKSSGRKTSVKATAKSRAEQVYWLLLRMNSVLEGASGFPSYSPSSMSVRWHNLRRRRRYPV